MEEGNAPPLFLYTDYIWQMLNNALDIGITEEQFWSMTFAELDRLSKSKERVRKIKAKEKATFDYSLAVLIGSAIGCQLDNKAHFPTLYEAYQSLFVEEAEAEQQAIEDKKAELSILRFKNFAENYNKNINKEVANT